MSLDLTIGTLANAYRSGALTPAALVEKLLVERRKHAAHNIWISVVTDEALRARARELADIDPASLPLYGIPFAIKDNIDFAGLPTTAGCAAFAYQPAESNPVVQALIDAGAIALGKTNLDQFATGLVGTRSPYGICSNAFDPAYISGGSSSGSAVAVALGLASFSLGTDTAGSGRVPAAFNNLVGYKPTLGSLSMRGVVPACRSLDAMSIFALTAEDAARVAAVAVKFDAADAWSRTAQLPARRGWGRGAKFRFGVPRTSQLEFFGNPSYAELFDASVQRLRELGGEAVRSRHRTAARDRAPVVRRTVGGRAIPRNRVAAGHAAGSDARRHAPDHLRRRQSEGARCVPRAVSPEGSHPAGATHLGDRTAAAAADGGHSLPN